MNDLQRFERAVSRIDEANARDPRTETVDGTPVPKELLFSRRVSAWIERLVDDPSDALRIAARAHTLGRWSIPREDFPMDTPGYHRWRAACADHHAEEADRILRDVGYDDDFIQDVRAFIAKANWPQDAEALALEDADCLVFLETKLPDYVDAWDEPKARRILAKTWAKMTPKARELVADLNLPDPARALLHRAVEG